MPITTTPNDVILTGHGSYQGGAAICPLPAHVELHLLQPVGSALTETVVNALVGNLPIDRLIVEHNASGTKTVDDLSRMGIPQVYTGPTNVPNLVLHDLADLKASTQAAVVKGPNHVVMVSKDTVLSDLLLLPDIQQLIRVHTAANTNLRIFWAACTSATETTITGTPGVHSNGRAVALALSAAILAKPNRTQAEISAACRAVDYAALHLQDTAGVIAAATAVDPQIVSLLPGAI